MTKPLESTLKKYILIIVLFPAISLSMPAQESLEDMIFSLLDKAFNVNIVARVTEGGEETVWNMEISRLTISGRSVKVKVNAGNIVVLATITPYEDYKKDKKTVLLVVQGQTFVRGKEEDEVKIQSAFQSIPVRLGEPVFFFPLGVNFDLETGDYRSLNIQLEIQIDPFESD